VQIIDITEMIRHFNGFDEIRAHIAEELTALIGFDVGIAKKFNILVRGIKFNLNLIPFLSQYGPENLALAIDDRVDSKDLSTVQNELRDILVETARQVAVKYSSIHLAMKYFNVFDTLFPNALRATIHPKPGQIAIAKSGYQYPWNGVPLVQNFSNESIFDNVEVLELSRLLAKSKGKRLKKLFLESDSAPFCYQLI